MDRAGVAKVAVAAAKFHIDRPYDYLVPAGMLEKAAVGCRVMVPFGAGNRLSEGLILAIEPMSERRKLKSVAALLGEGSVLDEKGVKLALWMRERYFCTVFDAVKALLPAGIWFSVKYTYSLAPDIDPGSLNPRKEGAAEVLRLIEELGGSAELEDIRAAMDFDPADVLRYLTGKKLVIPSAHQVQTGGDKTAQFVSLSVSAEEAAAAAESKRRKAPLQSEVLNLLAQAGEVSQKELCYFTGASSATIKALVNQNLVTVTKQTVLRMPPVPDTATAGEITLTRQQKRAYDGINGLIKKKKAAAALLYGVTGSGKTSVYINLIKSVIAQGRKAMVLVPEIALTPQLVSIFSGHFGGKIAVLHSSLKLGERHDEWKRIREGKVDVVVGARSAVFAPLDNIGLIILDEEQESSYKSESNPRYHARDVAKFRCVQHEAVLLLGSATPCVESMYAAKTGRYSYFELTERYNTRPLPEVIVADTRDDLRDGRDSAVGGVLRRKIEKNLEAGEQSILFVNRRGASRMVTCAQCGTVPQCPRCSVALTYHSSNKRLMCHYCGYSQKLMGTCPECGGELVMTGYGTQKVEQELAEIFPGVSVLRMDADTVSPGNTHEDILAAFGRGEGQILLGTQMVTKGLDFENVTLVGVLDADMSLYAGNFRAAERTFSLITQVVGRSGRGEREGRAVIQTCTPGNEVIRLAAQQDYPGFYKREIELRRAMDLPPFEDCFVVTASGAIETDVLRCAAKMRDVLSRWAETENVPMKILGPVSAKILKVNNRYRYRLTVLCRDRKKPRWLISSLVREFSAGKENKGVFVFADINPLED